MRLSDWNLRFSMLALLLAGTGVFLQTRTRKDILPPGPPLSSLPLHVGNWIGTDIPFDPQTLASLGPGEFIQRSYRDEAGKPAVDLYLAHRPRPNRLALMAHLPTECLIGSGWSLAESATTTASLPGYPQFTANRYVISKGSDRQLVMFWFWTKGESVASEHWADVYLTLDSLRLNRSDYMLVRINTPLLPGQTTQEAQRNLLSFAADLLPLLRTTS
ncbi:MAG TPA: EpsI family protein [Terriglobales bacterium]|nr:EpsI family protein [Terriglobales bacterium]